MVRNHTVSPALTMLSRDAKNAPTPHRRRPGFPDDICAADAKKTRPRTRAVLGSRQAWGPRRKGCVWWRAGPPLPPVGAPPLLLSLMPRPDFSCREPSADAALAG